jgi:uncharacterized protein (TIGR02611 family)
VTSESRQPRRAERPSLVERLQTQKERHLMRSRFVRGLYVVAGFTVLCAGLAMLVLPGPALVVIPIGLAILALEFTWAETLLQRSLEQAAKAKQKASDTTATQKLLTGIAVALAIAAVVVWALLGDIPLVPYL